MRRRLRAGCMGAMTGQRLSALDATFLELEDADPSAHMHIGGVMTFAAHGGFDVDGFVALIGRRLALVPRWRQKVREVPVHLTVIALVLTLIAVIATKAITDRYVTGTRLRLREVREGDHVVRKLGHKVRLTEGPAEVACTNLYLDEAEWAAVQALPGTTTSKVISQDPIRSGKVSSSSKATIASWRDGSSRAASR